VVSKAHALSYADFPLIARRDAPAFRPTQVRASKRPNSKIANENIGGHETIRWTPGERLNHLIERRCAELDARIAVETDTEAVTYRELDARANQLARLLLRRGVCAGDRIGLLLDKSAGTYITMLAVMKVNAAYVPLDAGFPIERLRFIAGDAELRAIVSTSCFAEKLAGLDLPHVLIDRECVAIGAEADEPLTDQVAETADQTCYIIYTSGTTGHPKGVIVEHPSICNFVRVASELYDFAVGDRVFQGMSIAFDFSVEEIWVPLMAGATLVPAPAGGTLVGEELGDFLRRRHVTGMACCPTLLATIEQDLPELRVLLVGGEACPQNLVQRWSRPGRSMLNTYGPTEATVTASLVDLKPNRPVTIGRPLPTYSMVILDPAEDRALAPGEFGEIGIAGIGLARGYRNRADLTAKKFIPDFLGLKNNPSRRIYRTGDLGRVNADGEIEYCGRIDTQVKIRGYRIETTEIESLLLELPQIAQAAVGTYEPEPDMPELVAYYSLKQGMKLARNDVFDILRKRLPAYMVPAFLEELPFIPMLISSKADHKRLPKPKSPRCQTRLTVVAAKTETEQVLARALAEMLKIEAVSTEAHFFNDLGAHSLLMARFCARIRQNGGMSHVSMRDIYQNPTVARLAAHLEAASGTTLLSESIERFHTPSNFSYYGCGALQLAVYAAYAWVSLWFSAVSFEWTYEAIGYPLDLYLRAVATGVAGFVGFSALPVATKWLLIGKWTPGSFPIWSLRYFRFWTVKTLTRTAPATVFPGPIYNWYLRALGAKIGKNAVVLSRLVPVATDLLSVGDNTILRKESIVLGYRARSNFIEVGAVEIGTNAFVGEASVLDIDTAMGDRSQLGHASSLQSGQRVPDDRRYHGSPAVDTTTDYCRIDNEDGASLRRGIYAAMQLFGLLAVATPASIIALDCLYEAYVPSAAAIALGASHVPLALLLIGSAVLMLGALILGLAAIYVIPRICNRFLKPNRVYPMFGLHYWLQSTVETVSNSRFYNLLFGDSSYIVNYMRLVGWKLNKVEQTGSNFGTNQRHDNPFLCEIGSGTMVSDGLSMINMHMSSSSFRLCPTRIGERNYLGNDIRYPSDGRTGANCLLGTKVMVPIDGPVRENVGLLGSPCFEIPRSVERDNSVNAGLSAEVRRERIARKNVHNIVTAALFLLTRWFFVVVSAGITEVGIEFYSDYGTSALLAAAGLVSAISISYFSLIERASIAFHRLAPIMVSIYDPYFWSHERHWKLSDSPIMQAFPGTPFKNLVLWLAGVKIGRKVYDAGCSITERTLTEIGDGANLNEGSVLQAHSLEEGVFKSDLIRVGAGSTLGTAAFVHYGSVLSERVVLEADSFLMKGEILDSDTTWRGNPAKLVRYNRRADASLSDVDRRELEEASRIAAE
jgi:non-ribosomal peptide synthetase-like protein